MKTVKCCREATVRIMALYGLCLLAYLASRVEAMGTGPVQKQALPPFENIRKEQNIQYLHNLPRLEKGGMVKFPAKIAGEPATYPNYFDWIKRFRFCLVRSPQYFTSPYLDELHHAGCRLFIRLPFGRMNINELRSVTGLQRSRYEAYRMMYAHPEWLLNPTEPVRRKPDAPPAYFFDFNKPEFRRFFTGWLRRRLEETGYDGVYFDIMGSYGLPPEVQAVWRDKYPDTSYDEVGGQFVKELRQAIGSKLIGGNMAYRAWTHYFPHIDYSHKESHGTGYRNGKEAEIYIEGQGLQKVRETFYRPWDGPNGYKEINKLRLVAEARYPHVNTFDLNYILPLYVPTRATAEVDGRIVPVFAKTQDQAAIFYGYALAKLSDRGCYACDVNRFTIEQGTEWVLKFVQNEVHFLDLGVPLENSYRELDEVVIRYFENGFVAVTRHNGSVRFQVDAAMIPRDRPGLWDVYVAAPVQGWQDHHAVEIEPSYYLATKSYHPSGRVYIYVR